MIALFGNRWDFGCFPDPWDLAGIPQHLFDFELKEMQKRQINMLPVICQ